MKTLKKIFSLIVLASLVLQEIYVVQDFSASVFAQSPAVPIFSVYRDENGGESIGTTPLALSWDTPISQHAEIPLSGGNSNFQLTAGGHYLVMYSVPVRSTSGGNRSEVQSWLQLNGSTNLQYGYASSYIRRANNDQEGYNESSAIIEAGVGDTLSVNMQRTDTNSAGIQRSAGRSGVNILKLDDSWPYARLRPSSNQAITTNWEKVNVSNADELDSADFSLSGNQLTLEQQGKYLVTYNVGSITTGTDRTNNEMRLTLDGTEVDATRSHAYIRAQNGSYTGISSFVGIIETTAAQQVLELQIRRESSMQGTTNNTIPEKTGLSIVKLPNSADYLRMSETGGDQDITTNLNTPVTFDTTLEQGTSLIHSSSNLEEINVTAGGDYLFLHSIYNARSDTINGPRENPYLEWQLNGITVKYGNSGSYNRNANDGDGITNSSHSSAGAILPGLGSGDTIELTETNEATNASSRYKGGHMGIQVVNLASLFTGSAYISLSNYRFRDNSADFNTNSGWLGGERVPLSGVQKGEIIRLRTSVENGSSFSYTNPSSFKLQWHRKTGSICGNQTWVNIDVANDDWEMQDTIHITPNAESSNISLLSNPLAYNQLRSEGYHEENGLTETLPANTFIGKSKKEYEFSLRATNNALTGGKYCFRLFNEEESSALANYIYPEVELDSNGVYLDSIWGEAGDIVAPANGAWITLNFLGNYVNPVIIGRGNSHDDPSKALVFEAKNITATSADVRLCDSNASNADGCQPHAPESIGYVIVDTDKTATIPGIDAGTFSASESFDTPAGLNNISYNKSFSNIPYVFTSVQSTNGASPIVTRVSSSNISGFTGGICEQEGSEDECNASHIAESVGWIAIDPTMNPFVLDMDIGTGVSTSPSNIWSSVGFTTSFSTNPMVIAQTVTNNGGQDSQIDEIQNISANGMEFRSCELDNDNDCDGHAIDTVRWMAIEKGIFGEQYFLDETHYRWYENTNSLTPMIPLEDENKTLRNIPINNQLRLRVLIQNTENTIPSGSLALKLQYANTLSCETATWSDVGNIGSSADFIMHDNPSLTDGNTLPSSLLHGGGHVQARYSESLATAGNPNNIPEASWSEWDFSLRNNTGTSSLQYCMRVVTADNNEIQYSQYIKIDTSDNIAPSILSHSPDDNFLFPLGTFYTSYTFFDGESGIDINTYTHTIRRWNGIAWGSDISNSYESVDDFTSTGASFSISGLPYGRYQFGFEVYDNAGNHSYILHEIYVDEVEFIVSDSEHDIGLLSESMNMYNSADELIVTVKTVGAGFEVFMQEDTILSQGPLTIPYWDGSEGFGYKTAPYTGSLLSSELRQTLGTQVKNLHPDGEKYTYQFPIKFSSLLSDINDYTPGSYEALYDFGIELDY